MADATINPKLDNVATRITVGLAANRPAYYKGAPCALHFASDTPYAISFFDGVSWQSIMVGGAA